MGPVGVRRAMDEVGAAVEQREEEPGLDSSLAPVALFLFITSIWLAWWTVRWEDATGFRYEEVGVRLFGSGHEVAHNQAPIVTGVLVALGTLILFIRVAAKSWHHEPHLWRRDLWAAFGFGAAALVSVLWWPAEVPAFWGGRTYELVNDTSQHFTETALPGLGWWVALLATGLTAAAAVLAGRRLQA